jgi:hypothetical protein
MAAEQQPCQQAPEPQLRDFLFYIETHVHDTFEFSGDKVNLFVDVALTHSIEPYSVQSERGKRILDAALFSLHKYATADEFIVEFGRLCELLRKTQAFALRVYQYASKTFADNGAFEEDFRFKFMLNEWQKTAFEYLRTEISAIAGAIFDVLRDARKPSSRWYSSVINPLRSEEDLEHERREQPYYEASI